MVRQLFCKIVESCQKKIIALVEKILLEITKSRPAELSMGLSGADLNLTPTKLTLFFS